MAELVQQIQELKEARNAVILVHNYQRPEIYGIATLMSNTYPVNEDSTISVDTSELTTDDIDGDARPLGSAPDVGADEYNAPTAVALVDLRVTEAFTDSITLRATLRWTAPSDAVTTTLHYSDTAITETNWYESILLTNTLPGESEIYNAVVPDFGKTTYFSLKTQNVQGIWSPISNNAYWPEYNAWFPLILNP